MRLLATLGMAIALCPTFLDARTHEPLPAAEVEGFVVEMAVDRTTLDQTGAPYGVPFPTLRYRFARTRTTSGWRMTLRVDDSPSGAERPGPASPFAGGWIEVDDDGSAPRVFNNRGDRVYPELPLPPFEAPMVAALDGTLVFKASDAAARRIAMERAFGPRVGRRQSLDRFVRVDGDRTEELLAQADLGVPRQLTVMRAGRIESRTTFDYETEASGDLVRRVTVTETPVPDRDGHRLVTRTTITRIAVGGGR